MKIEQFEQVTIAYMRSVGEYGLKNKELMETFKDFLREEKLLDNASVILGIALDNPQIVPINELRYDVGLIVKERQVKQLNTRSIENGNYAIFEVTHTMQGVQKFWESIPKLAQTLVIDENKPIIERYRMDKIKQHLCEFCIPLKE